MSSIIQSGQVYRIVHEDDIKVYDRLPVGTYLVDFNKMTEEFFLRKIDDFKMPKKIYGDLTPRAERILRTFSDRGCNTGVLLNGVKGAGKTLLAKQTAVLAQKSGIPTIVINNSWHGDHFNEFIQRIDGPTVVLFDEFEKVYDYSTQSAMLTLLDGVFPAKKLFVVTSNREDDLVEFLMNRPGRIYYKFSFDTLTQEFIKEYCEDNLVDVSHIPDILKYTEIFSFFNFDMLAAVVEEMNRYDEALPDVLGVLNIIPENKRSDNYTVTVTAAGVTVEIEDKFSGFQPNHFEYYVHAGDDMDPGLREKETLAEVIDQVAQRDRYGDTSIPFKPAMLTHYDRNTGTFVYTAKKENHAVELRVKRNDRVPEWSMWGHAGLEHLV